MCSHKRVLHRIMCRQLRRRNDKCGGARQQTEQTKLPSPPSLVGSSDRAGGWTTKRKHLVTFDPLPIRSGPDFIRRGATARTRSSDEEAAGTYAKHLAALSIPSIRPTVRRSGHIWPDTDTTTGAPRGGPSSAAPTSDRVLLCMNAYRRIMCQFMLIFLQTHY
jgi:hypothetical protein